MGGSQHWARAIFGLGLPLVLTSSGMALQYVSQSNDTVSADVRVSSINYIRARLTGNRTRHRISQEVGADGRPVFISIWEDGKPSPALRGRVRISPRPSFGNRRLAAHNRLVGRSMKAGTIKVDRVVDSVTLP